MKIKTLLPILGLTSVAAAAPVVASCAQNPVTNEFTLNDWSVSMGIPTVKLPTTTIFDIKQNTEYTFNVNWDGCSASGKLSGFTFASSGTIDESKVSVTINGDALSKVDAMSDDDGYYVAMAGLVVRMAKTPFDVKSTIVVKLQYTNDFPASTAVMTFTPVA